MYFIRSILLFALSSFQNMTTPYLISDQKKVTVVAMTVFSLVAAFYLTYPSAVKSKFNPVAIPATSHVETFQINNKNNSPSRIELKFNPIPLDGDVKPFSSYTKGLCQVSEVIQDRHALRDNLVNLKLILPNEFQQKLQKRIAKFPNSSILSLNGVLVSKLSISEAKDDQNMKVWIIASIAMDLFLKSDLENIEPPQNVSLGMASINPSKSLLDGTPIGKVKLKSVTVARDHTFTQELLFECSKDQYDQIKDLKYMGLNGCGFFIQQKEEVDQCYTFTVYACQRTRKKTIFNQTDISPGTECTLTLPFVVT
jgi:hypothetical protein